MTSTCQFLEGEPHDRNFCGQPTKPGSPYCPEHHRICYRKPTESEMRLISAQKKKPLAKVSA